MVFFTCFHCGESVKKPAVSKHYETKCRNRQPYLTCVDCLKDFKENEYEAHTKCVTEEERYSAKGFVPKPSQNKGERKQQAWQDCIQTLLKKPTLKQDERDLITTLSKYENVPRKKNKFINFLSNGIKHYANKTELIDRVWTEMESVFKEMVEKEKQQEGNEKKSDENQDDATKSPEKTEGNEKKKEKKKKRKAEENEVAEAPETENGKKKSGSKKAKYSEGDAVENDNNEMEVNGTDAGKSSKKKKKKHSKSSENEIKENTEPTEPDSKSKKKKKKEKNGVVEGEEKVEEVETCNGTQSKGEKKSKKSKAKPGSDGEKEEEFNWKGIILKIINQKGKDNKIELQKLQENVFKLYSKKFQEGIQERKKEKKFMKKLKKIPQIKISDNLVELQS